MTPAQCARAIEAGIALVEAERARGADLIGTGEMGIGNTTAASAIVAALTGASPESVTGPGTGVDAAGRRRKVEAVRRALAVNRPDPADALDTLAKVGGFEIAGLVGVILAGAAARLPVVLDGFIAGAAALAAVRLRPEARGALLAAHRSAEPGHARVLEALGLEPYLDLGLRLGEGTGAALCIGLARAAVGVLTEHGDLQVRRRLGSAGRPGCALVTPCRDPAARRARAGVPACCPEAAAALTVTDQTGRRVVAAGAARAHRLARAQRDRDRVHDRRPGPAGRRHRLLRLPARGPAEAQRRRHGLAEPRGDRGAQARPRGRHHGGQST